MSNINQHGDEMIELSELFKYMEQDLYREWIHWDWYGCPLERNVFDEAVRRMLRNAAIRGNILSFDRSDDGGAVRKVKAYHYFLLWSRELQDNSDAEDEEEDEEYEFNPYQLHEHCTIEGFDSFEELSKRINTDKKGRLFSVYVKMHLAKPRYEKAFCRFSYQKPGRPLVYTTNEGFYHTDEDTCCRIPDAEYQLEIVGLCEICSEKGIVTTIANSMDEIEQLLHCMAYDFKNCDSQQYDEAGTFRYENTEYRYDLNGEEHCSLIISDEDSFYCRHRHEFVPKCAMKQAERDCDLCAVFVSSL